MAGRWSARQVVCLNERVTRVSRQQAMNASAASSVVGRRSSFVVRRSSFVVVVRCRCSLSSFVVGVVVRRGVVVRCRRRCHCGAGWGLPNPNPQTYDTQLWCSIVCGRSRVTNTNSENKRQKEEELNLYPLACGGTCVPHYESECFCAKLSGVVTEVLRVALRASASPRRAFLFARSCDATPVAWPKLSTGRHRRLAM